MFRLDKKLANIRNGRYKRSDFMIADAKDGDMGLLTRWQVESDEGEYLCRVRGHDWS
jgi:hypothetical protein